jgi:hypothetical protein
MTRNRNLGIVLLVVVAGFFVALFIGSRRYGELEHRAARESAALRLRAEALERMAWLRSNPDADAYRSEVKNFFKWYFDQVSAQQARFGGNPAFDDYVKEVEAKAKAAAEAELPQLPDGRPRGPLANPLNRRAFWEWEKAMFDRMRTGKYTPVLTGTDKGLRLDVVSADVVVVGNKPKIRFPLVLWGAQRETKEDDRPGIALPGVQVVKRVMTWADFASTFRLLDDKGKLYGEMSTTNPGMRNDFPERLIAEFPPQMVLGQYELDPVPANVTTMEMLVSVRSHAPSGGDINAQYVWKVPVPEEWKLKPGEVWEGATETTRTEEEIDPAVAARKARR